MSELKIVTLNGVPSSLFGANTINHKMSASKEMVGVLDVKSGTIIIAGYNMDGDHHDEIRAKLEPKLGTMPPVELWFMIPAPKIELQAATDAGATVEIIS